LTAGLCNLLVGGALAAATADGSRAREARPPTAQDCVRVQREGGTTVEMSDCAQQQLQRVDGRLNAVYGRLRKAMGAEDRQALKLAQRAWIGWRDQEATLCALASGFGVDGSGHALVRLRCLGRLTEQRADELERLLQMVRGR
jgi:uncharacterized protein YecT (DUF1311 family)